MTRGIHVYYAQSKEHPADPMRGQGFCRKYEMAAWVKGREDEFRYFRYDSYEDSCKAIGLNGDLPNT